MSNAMVIADALLDTDIFGSLLQSITSAIEQLGYLGIFIGMALSSTPLPVPSEVVMPFAGYVVWRGELTLIGVMLAGTFGCLVGSLIDYAIGLYGGRPFIQRYGKFLLMHENGLDDAKRWFDRYGGRAVFICKVVPLAGIYISFLAGIVRMDVKSFSAYTVFASFLWCLALVYIGLLLGPDWSGLAESFKYLEIPAVVGIIGVIAYLIYRLQRKPSHAID